MIQLVSPPATIELQQRRDGRPHVLLVVDQFPKTLGGGERIVLKIAALLPQFGYRVSILTFYIHPESNLPDSATCAIYLLSLERTYDAQAFRAAGCLRQFLKKEGVQIVQTFFESSDLWAGAVAKTVAGVKLVWSRRDMGILRGRKHRIAYKIMADTPDAVFAVSEQVRRHGIALDGLDPDIVETIYNGSNLQGGDEHDRRSPAPSASIVLTVGNIRRVKGHDVLIRAAAYIVAWLPGVSFRVAGAVLELDYFRELQNLICELGLSKCFHFLGESSDLLTQYREANVFVLPSRSEGFSNAIVEAMASSLPVVATDVGGNAEAVIHGITGIVVPPEDPLALAQGLMRVLSDPMAARQMGKAGRQAATEKFTTEAMMSRITRTYAKLLGRDIHP